MLSRHRASGFIHTSQHDMTGRYSYGCSACNLLTERAREVVARIIISSHSIALCLLSLHFLHKVTSLHISTISMFNCHVSLSLLSLIYYSLLITAPPLKPSLICNAIYIYIYADNEYELVLRMHKHSLNINSSQWL
jgi:hypothetical protein